MMIKYFSLTVLLILLYSNSTRAGDHKPLCQKVSEADLVFEMHFDVKGSYPSNYFNKGWAPPESSRVQTSKTGKVVQVFKGTLKPGANWLPAYGELFNQGSFERWKKFYQRKQFSSISFLKQSGNKYKTVGWAEETAGCSSSAQYSWCPGFNEFKKKIQECPK